MSGKLPIDRVREARDAPSVYQESHERFARKQAHLDQTDELAEGERPPEATETAGEATEPARSDEPRPDR